MIPSGKHASISIQNLHSVKELELKLAGKQYEAKVLIPSYVNANVLNSKNQVRERRKSLMLFTDVRKQF